MSRHSQVK